MLEEASGDVVFDRDEVEAAFDELASLKRSIGASTFAQLNRLLPFSRNDHWEVSELRDRIKSSRN